MTTDRIIWRRDKPVRGVSDSSSYSRAFLGEPVYGQEYATRCAMMRQGSRDLLHAIEGARA